MTAVCVYVELGVLVELVVITGVFENEKASIFRSLRVIFCSTTLFHCQQGALGKPLSLYKASLGFQIPLGIRAFVNEYNYATDLYILSENQELKAQK